jgi:hypothetical protein
LRATVDRHAELIAELIAGRFDNVFDIVWSLPWLTNLLLKPLGPQLRWIGQLWVFQEVTLAAE